MTEVKTTINIDEDLWKQFSVLVIRKEGLRKKNEVIEELILLRLETQEDWLSSVALLVRLLALQPQKRGVSFQLDSKDEREEPRPKVNIES